MPKTILRERKNGGFGDWTDFEKRVKGVGARSSDKPSQAGLTIDGQATPNAPAALPAKAASAARLISASVPPK